MEQEGTYNLPEAELDRFLMKLLIQYPAPENEREIIKSCGKAPLVPVNSVITAADVKLMQQEVENVSCDEKLIDYIVSILKVTRPAAEQKQDSYDITNYIHFGASPRAGIAMLQCSKVHAAFEGRDYVLPEDIKAVANNVLRHRLVLSYEAAADNITADEIISRILDYIPVP